MTKRPLQLGILGCGDFAVRRILPALKEVDSIRVVSIQNRSLAKAEAIALQFGIPYAVSQREDLLAHPEVEAIAITSPNFLHEEDAIACAIAGKPTLCEKPLSLSWNSTHRMVEAFAARSLPFFVGHQIRFKPAVQKAKELLSGGEFGALLHARAHFYSWPLPPGNWRLAQGNGGGALQEIGVHLVDLLHFLTGEEIGEVRAFSSPFSEADQMISLQGRLESGALVSLECGYGRAPYNGFEIIGTKGRLASIGSLRQTYDPVESLCLSKENGQTIHYPLQAVNVYVEEYRHLAEAIREKIPSPIEANIGLANQAVIDAAYRSLEQPLGSKI